MVLDETFVGDNWKTLSCSVSNINVSSGANMRDQNADYVTWAKKKKLDERTGIPLGKVPNSLMQCLKLFNYVQRGNKKSYEHKVF